MSQKESSSKKTVLNACEEALTWAEGQNYAGYDPYDGLNSPILSAISRNWLLRLLSIHGVNRAPFNLRPLLGVPKERNPKGIALFALSYLNLYEATGIDTYLSKAENLLEWLRENQSPDFEKPAWGYNFDWQNARKFYIREYQPNIVVTVYAGLAFIKHYELTNKASSLEIARGASEFIRTGINTQDYSGTDVFSYTPYGEFIVINANALAARFFIELWAQTDSSSYLKRASELYDFVVDAQVSEGAWYYAMPASDSHLSHDNFHTGFVLESLYRYLELGEPDASVEKAYQNGIEFYRNNLFEENGAPKFEHDQSYPYDVHASAQAIVTFSQNEYEKDTERAINILSWTHENLYDDAGYFYRRQGRFLHDKTPYIRWSQAWMCSALSSLTLTLRENQ